MLNITTSDVAPLAPSQSSGLSSFSLSRGEITPRRDSLALSRDGRPRYQSMHRAGEADGTLNVNQHLRFPPSHLPDETPHHLSSTNRCPPPSHALLHPTHTPPPLPGSSTLPLEPSSLSSTLPGTLLLPLISSLPHAPPRHAPSLHLADDTISPLSPLVGSTIAF